MVKEAKDPEREVLSVITKSWVITSKVSPSQLFAIWHMEVSSIHISGLIYEETCGILKVFLENLIHDAVTYTEHAERKSITAMDAVNALSRQGPTLYGFGG